MQSLAAPAGEQAFGRPGRTAPPAALPASLNHRTGSAPRRLHVAAPPGAPRGSGGGSVPCCCSSGSSRRSPNRLPVAPRNRLECTDSTGLKATSVEESVSRMAMPPAWPGHGPRCCRSSASPAHTHWPARVRLAKVVGRRYGIVTTTEVRCSVTAGPPEPRSHPEVLTRTPSNCYRSRGGGPGTHRSLG